MPLGTNKELYTCPQTAALYEAAYSPVVPDLSIAELTRETANLMVRLSVEATMNFNTIAVLAYTMSIPVNKTIINRID